MACQMIAGIISAVSFSRDKCTWILGSAHHLMAYLWSSCNLCARDVHAKNVHLKLYTGVEASYLFRTLRSRLSCIPSITIGLTPIGLFHLQSHLTIMPQS